MSKEKVSIKSNFMYQMSYQILLIILPFITSPYIARIIGASGLGDYSFSFSIAYYFMLFANLGIQNYGNRTIAQCKEDATELSQTFSNLLAVHIIVSALSLIMYYGYAVCFPSNKQLALIQSFMVWSSLFDISWFYFGIEKFKLISLRSTVMKILTVFAVFAFVKTADDLWKYCAIMSIGMLFGNLFLWIPLHRYVHFSRPQLNKIVVHIKPLIILFVPSIAVSLYKYMDKIMMGCLSTNTQLGFYENAEKAINIPTTVISSFGMVMLPRMSSLIAKKSWKQINENIKKSMQFVMWMAMAFTFGLLGVSVDFATFFWGEEFLPSGYIMMGLALTIPFTSFANVIRTQLLIPAKRDREYIISVFLGAGVNLLINYLLIPTYGSYGAVVGTVLAEISVCISQCLFVHDKIQFTIHIKDCFFYSLFGCVMLLFVFFIHGASTNSLAQLFFVIVIAGSLYCVFSIIYFKITKSSWIFDIIRSVLKGKK